MRDQGADADPDLGPAAHGPDARRAAAAPLALAIASIARRTADVDAGAIGTHVAIRELGAAGAFAPIAEGDVATAASLIERLARECVATAFSAWGHSVTIAYHRVAGIAPPAALVEGRALGASAMAPAFKFASGLGELPVRARRDGDGWRLDGALPWASNLVPGATAVLPVLGDDGVRRIVRLRLDARGVEVRPLRDLLALDGTASGSLRLDDVAIAAEDALPIAFAELLQRVRPSFLLLQTAFCLGLAGRAADEADAALAGSITEVVFAERRAEVRERLRALRGDYHALLSRASSGAARPIAPERLLRLRLDAARLVREATGLEAAAVGGRGYLAASGTARRLREAAFLPVQSPTEGHLEWELRRLRG